MLGDSETTGSFVGGHDGDSVEAIALIEWATKPDGAEGDGIDAEGRVVAPELQDNGQAGGFGPLVLPRAVELPASLINDHMAIAASLETTVVGLRLMGSSVTNDRSGDIILVQDDFVLDMSDTNQGDAVGENPMSRAIELYDFDALVWSAQTYDAFSEQPNQPQPAIAFNGATGAHSEPVYRELDWLAI